MPGLGMMVLIAAVAVFSFGAGYAIAKGKYEEGSGGDASPGGGSDGSTGDGRARKT